MRSHPGVKVMPEFCRAAVSGPGPAPEVLLSWYTRGDNPAMSALFRRSPGDDKETSMNISSFINF